MASADSINNNVGQRSDNINSFRHQDSVNNFSVNWPMAVTGQNAATPQFAMLYNGSMCVYDGIPAEKVHEIMMMASANAKSSEMKSGIPFTSLISTSPSSPQGGTSNNLASLQSVSFPVEKSSICRIQEFPITRRQSLQMFLEKRKIRLGSKAPYTSSTSKKVNNVENNFSSVLRLLEGK